MKFVERSMTSLADIATPALLLDRDKLEKNCSLMRRRMNDLGVQFRPHMKTAKAVSVASIALGKANGPITVSTLHEAFWFANQGFYDLLYAVGFNPQKLDQAIRVKAAGAALTLITDNAGVATELATRAADANCYFAVLIEIDSGQGRGGVLPGAPALLEIARILHESSGTELAGVLTHAGHSYDCSSTDEIRLVAESERAAVVEAASRLRAAGLPCGIVSAGSTPTATHGSSLEGITEMRPGVYQFGDLAQVCLASCNLDDIAISVLATVIGHNHPQSKILIDAGALAMSKDKSASQYRDDWAYGLVCDLAGNLIEPVVTIAELEQEHGFIEVAGQESLFESFPVGSRLRILPNHACMTAAAFSGYHVVESGNLFSNDFWPRCNGWG